MKESEMLKRRLKLVLELHEIDVRKREDIVKNLIQEIESVTKEEYEKLVYASELLICLEACGVDNWSGYSDAVRMVEEEEDTE